MVMITPPFASTPFVSTISLSAMSRAVSSPM
jgi:hypothetical protein